MGRFVRQELGSKERQKAAGKEHGRGQPKGKVVVNLPQPNEGQAAMEMFKKEAKERQKELGKAHGEDPCDKFSTRGKTRDQAGKAIGVSGGSISHAETPWRCS